MDATHTGSNEMKFPIMGKSTLIRCFGLSDINDEYISWLNNKEVMKYSNQRFILHSDQTCRSYFQTFKNTNNYFLAIEDLQSRKLIGTITVYRQLNHCTADIGILIGEMDKTGKGYGYDAFSSVMLYLLRVCKTRKVTAGALKCNHAMVKVMEKSGMHLEAVRPKQEIMDGEPVDVVYYSRFA